MLLLHSKESQISTGSAAQNPSSLSGSTLGVEEGDRKPTLTIQNSEEKPSEPVVVVVPEPKTQEVSFDIIEVVKDVMGSISREAHQVRREANEQTKQVRYQSDLFLCEVNA